MCAAYLQGGLDKALDLNGAINELQHFRIAPAAPMAIAAIITELVRSARSSPVSTAGWARFGLRASP
jgi:hypothetical protein